MWCNSGLEFIGETHLGVIGHEKVAHPFNFRAVMVMEFSHFVVNVDTRLNISDSYIDGT